MYSIIGWNSTIGRWSRIEGTPCDPNPNKPFAKMENFPLFNNEGKLNPSITILGLFKIYIFRYCIHAKLAKASTNLLSLVF